MTNHILAFGIYLVSFLAGIAAFLYPFFLPVISPAGAADTGRLESTALLTAVLIILSLLAVVIELQGETVSAKMVAALGVMVALAAALRFVETALPGPAGFSPIFVPVILAGYTFGARFGYLMGIMTILVSALITGGVGPWLPYQMLVAGWVGATAGWLPHYSRREAELALLVMAGVVWGFLYGFLINLYSWPFFAGSVAISYQPGNGIGATVAQYLAFYGVTSFVWDIFRAAGNAILMLAFGIPAVRALTRFRQRLAFDVIPGRIDLPVMNE